MAEINAKKRTAQITNNFEFRAFALIISITANNNSIAVNVITDWLPGNRFKHTLDIFASSEIRFLGFIS